MVAAGFGRRVVGRDGRRFAGAVLAASLAAAALPLPLIVLVSGIAEGGTASLRTILAETGRAAPASIVLLPLALMLTLLGGVPAHMLLVARGLTGFGWYLLLGGLAGPLVFGGIAVLRGGGNWILPLLGCICGLAAAASFRAIWRKLP